MNNNQTFHKYILLLLLVFSTSSCNKQANVKEDNSNTANSSSSTSGTPNSNKDYESYLNSLPQWKPGNNNTLSPAHKDMLRKLVQKPAPKGKSWKGHWIFMITPADGYTLKPGISWVKTYFDASGKVLKSDRTPPAKNEIEHIGFITLDSATSGYDLTGYGLVKLPYYAMKVKGNRLIWNFAWIPVPADRRSFEAQVFYREVEYDPNTDTLHGRVISHLFMKQKNAKKEALVPIPVCEYVFKASRLSEEDFQRIANGKKRLPEFPNYEYIMMGSGTPQYTKHATQFFLNDESKKSIKLQAAKKRAEMEKQFLDK